MKRKSARSIAVTAVLVTVVLAASGADDGAPEPAPKAAPVGMVPTAAELLTGARAAIAAKDWAHASALLQRAEKLEPRNAEVQNLLGYSLRAQDKLPEAFAHYGKALEIDPNHRGAHNYVGHAYLKAGQPDKAREHLAKLQQLCGIDCAETRDLATAIAAYKP